MNVRHGYTSDIDAEVERLAATDEHVYASKFRRWFQFFSRSQFHIFLYDDLSSDPAGTVQGAFRFLGLSAFEPDVHVRHNPGGVPRSPFAQRLIDLPALRRLRPIVPAAAFDLVARLRSMNVRPPPPLRPELRQRLADRYRDDVLETQELLGLDLSRWLRDPGIGVVVAARER